MNKKIHDKDIDQEKQVFEVTIPKYNIEKMHMCVGNAYESSTKNKYNIYNVDKNTRKVTECVGYYELDKGKEVMDKDGDFNVRALGEEAIELYPEFVSSYSSKPKKAKTTETKSTEKSKKLPETVSLSPKYVVDDQDSIGEYFDNKYDLADEEIIPTYLKNFKKPKKWVEDVGVSLTGIFSDVYIIIANEQFEYDTPTKPSTSSTKTLDLDMTILPRIETLEYNKDRKYVLISYRSQTHYRLIESNGKVLFSETELPKKIIERFCTKHHPTEQMPDGVSEDEFPVKIIETTSSGDCFFDSIYRATKSVDINAAKDAYLDEVHKYRVEIADGVESNPVAQQLIRQLYRVNAVQDVDTIRNKFYNDKFARKATPEDDAVFKYAYSSLFGANKHNEDEFSFAEKEMVLTTYLTLMYEFFPDLSSEHQDEFKATYNSIYGVGKSMDIRDSLDKQRTALSKSMGKPKEETKVSELEKTPEPPKPPPVEEPIKVKKAKAPKTAPEPPKPVLEPVPEPEPSVPESSIDVSTITDVDSKAIVEIYLSSESQEEKKKKLEKYTSTKLKQAWKIVYESNKDLFRATQDNTSVIDCLSGDVTDKCTKKQTKKAAKAAKGGKQTRKNI
jgi:hypothetical protein